MEKKVLIAGIFIGAGLLASVVIPSLLFTRGRVPDHMIQLCIF
jgi:hypothetical protein